jgi:uncharacterized membrane protein YvlD (DUF360 family)
MRHLIRWIIVTAIIQCVVLLFLAWALPGFSLGETKTALLSAAIISIVLALAWPVINVIAGRFHPILFPILSFGLSGLAIYLVGVVDVEGFRVDSIWVGIVVSLGMTAGSVLIGAIFSLDDSMSYEWFVVRPLRKQYASTPKSTTPGILYLEIDGLALPILKQAIDGGYMPTLQRWIADGSHKLLPWEPDLSSQTSASQAGILLGDNTGIPAFRWYDKPSGKLMVSSKMETAKELERRLSSGEGLLTDGGASRWNVFSGDAPDCLCTFSAVGDHARNISRSYGAYFSNPYSLARMISLFFSDAVRERYQAWRQVRNDVQPRIKRHFKYAFIRGSTTTLMQEASLFMLISDMFRGVPAVYNTFFAYDEVAHHSGIDRPDAFKVLTTLDRVFAKLERASKLAPRPYEFVVLSDHGQSMGATFKQRFNQPLSDLVATLISPENDVLSAEESIEGWGNLNLALNEAIRQDSRTANLIQRAVKGQTTNGEVSLGPEGDASSDAKPQEAKDSDVVVLASGNLGLISFPAWKERMTFEQIVETFPKLLNGLADHEGISFFMVQTEKDGGVVRGAEGIHYLNDDHVVGSDPLATFGPNAARHLSRAHGFVNAPDILVMSMYDTETGEVAAFEELVGCHGGLGGTQTQPFVLHPAQFAAPSEPIVGAAALHQTLKSWRNLSAAPN